MSEIDELKAVVSSLTNRIGSLEDINDIRKLHYAYGYYIDYNWPNAVAELFSDDAEIIFLSGIYKGKEGARRLYGQWFQNFFTQGKPGPLDGFLLDHFQMQDIITVAEDRNTAKGRFRALLFGGTHETSDYKPEGLPHQWLEAGIYENEYVRENGVWKIKKLDYVLQWEAEYEKGWHNSTAHQQPQIAAYPENPVGPDVLVETSRMTWPHRHEVTMHYAHPVLAKAVRG